MEIVEIEGENYYKISNYDSMRPFFMSIVSDSNHWMFISSNGSLTAGRKNAEFALFPYYTEDKITELADNTGSKSIFQIQFNNQIYLWEPFSERFNDRYTISKNIYKNCVGNSLIFEEVLHDFQLTFRYQWNTSNLYGFVKKSELINHSENDYKIKVLDGLQNIMPFGVSSDLQNSTSNLVDGYKRNEIITESGIGIFALSAIIVDKAEPSEALKANIAWSLGMDNPAHLLSSSQLHSFRKKQDIVSETDIKGEKGAYFITTNLYLIKNTSKRWKIIANVNQNQSQVIQLSEAIKNDKSLEQKVQDDIILGKKNLIHLNASADGLQFSADNRKDTRHFSNVLFNIMRGGIFDCNYQLEKTDFLKYIEKANKIVFKNNINFLNNLPELFNYLELQHLLENQKDLDVYRLSLEYLPLKFSRRHGDPSRPWNKFSINTQSEIDGSKILDYEGNWRDIFQNWEALAYSYPYFIDGMIFKFLNASTFDGYNPYRVTKDGFDWETIEPDNPWSYIGYWGDHQIIYLLKFLEFVEKYQPNKLHSYLDKECFVYAAVPYKIKNYSSILQNPKDTIDYNYDWEKNVKNQKKSIGADGALLMDDNNEIYHVNFIEKILATVLSKMSNFIPEAGIWMNTQRPEWNDANNALVGNGVSMVTLYYLHRFLKFFLTLLETSPIENFKISNEMVEFYHTIRENLLEFSPLLKSDINDIDRKKIMDVLGEAASEYRNHVYQSGFWGKKRTVSMEGLKIFTNVCLEFIEHSINSNKREDKLYHAYNLITIESTKVKISHLPEMLEGQVAVLSSGYVKGKQALELLDSLEKSSLYRPDQNSYILYPNKELPRFLEKNCIPKEKVSSSNLLQLLIQNKNELIFNQDIKGGYHFNGNFHNARDLKEALYQLGNQIEYKDLVEKESERILEIFEEVFNHKAFTGRSGTFFAYEGLGSIYWHMVSKLHLAVQEICIYSDENKEELSIINALKIHFDKIGDGIGIHKSPKTYGAFPTDPYSHTPQHRGAQPPGMTGQVKEDILVRIGELGVKVKKSQLCFEPTLLYNKEFLEESKVVDFILADSSTVTKQLEKNSLAFTICQVPVIYKIDTKNQIEIQFENGKVEVIQGHKLDKETSYLIFQRLGKIILLTVSFTEDKFRK